MDETSVRSTMTEYAESSTAAMYSRNEDAMSRALRSEGMLGMEELIDLHRHTSTSPIDASSAGTLTSTVFSSHKPSTITKPTSAGRSYAGKDKAIATYESSLSATHGSGSDSELETVQDNALTGVGDWAVDAGTRTLKGSARARRRPRPTRRPKHKKPVVVIQQDGTGRAYDKDTISVTQHVTRANDKKAEYLRHRRMVPVRDQLELAEEGRIPEGLMFRPCPPEPLTRTRFYVLISLVAAIALTFSLFTFAAHHTGKRRMNCTKGLIFAGTVLVSCFTVLAMVVARRALLEALLLGLLEFAFGFALVVEINDFM